MVAAFLCWVLVLAACGGGEVAGPTSVNDLDSDGIADEDDDDIDGDGFSNIEEGNGEIDTDGDGIPDHRDRDSDNDGRFDIDEGRGDADGDGADARVDPDSDGDDIADGAENDGDDDDNGDGSEIAAAKDTDLDSIPDDADNCVETSNPDQDDRDEDGTGDACDGCPEDPVTDTEPCAGGDGGGPSSSEGGWCAGLAGGGGGPIFVPAEVSTGAGSFPGGEATIVALDGFSSNVFGGCVNTGGGYGGPIFRCDNLTIGLGDLGPAGVEVAGVYDDGIYFTFSAESMPGAIEVVGDTCDETVIPPLGPQLDVAELTGIAAINHADLFVVDPIDPATATPEELATQPDEAVRQLIQAHFTDLTIVQLAAIDQDLLVEAPAEQVPEMAPGAIAVLPPELLVQVAPESLSQVMGEDLNTLPNGYFQQLEPSDFLAFGLDATASLDEELLGQLDLPPQFVGVGDGLIELPGS